MATTHIRKKCPHCGYTFESYTPISKHQLNHSGHPFRYCPKCSKLIIDKDMKEPALKPPPKRPSVVNCLFAEFIPFGLGAILCTIPMFTDETFNFFALKGFLYCLILVITPAAVWIISIIWTLCNRDKTKRKLDEEYAASEKRLQIREYALMLKELGYKVPDKYIK